MASELYARDQHAKDAAVERLWSHTVGIANSALVSQGPDPGSGLPAREEESPGTGVAGCWAGHHFIITAKHVLDKASVEDLRFFPRPTGALTRVSEVTVNDAFIAAPLNDSTATIHRCEWEDLALVTLKPDSLGPYLEFSDLSRSWIDPSEGETVIGLGYPVSNASIFGRRVGDVFQKAVLLMPIGFSGEVLPSVTGRYFGQFDADRHYLIPYEMAADGTQHPRGISGAAVWVQSEEKQFVWAPAFKFAGVCTSCYKNGKVEQIVKASAVRQFLTETFGAAE
jgi:hypothetical protein